MGTGTAEAARSGVPAAGDLVVPSVVVRVQPDARSAVVARLSEFRPNFVRQIVLVTAIHVDARRPHRRWYRIVVPGRPNGRRGWIPAAAANVRPTTARIVVERGGRTLALYHRGRLVLRTGVAVGKPGAETPLGLFYVTWRFRPGNPFLGVFALETSAYSRLSDWPGGGVVGIHGTSAPWLLGRAVSHGCVRVSNAAARVLERHAPLGTPIEIRP